MLNMAIIVGEVVDIPRSFGLAEHRRITMRVRADVDDNRRLPLWVSVPAMIADVEEIAKGDIVAAYGPLVRVFDRAGPDGRSRTELQADGFARLGQVS